MLFKTQLQFYIERKLDLGSLLDALASLGVTLSASECLLKSVNPVRPVSSDSSDSPLVALMVLTALETLVALMALMNPIWPS